MCILSTRASRAAAIAVWCSVSMLACGDDEDPRTGDPTELTADEQRFQDRLELYSNDTRVPDSTNWQQVQSDLADALTGLGFAVELEDYGTGINVIGRLTGSSAPDELVYVGAHYDSIAGCVGVNDNGAGMSASLEIAEQLADETHARTLVIAFWDEEETGLIGATQHVANLDDTTLESIEIYYNFDAFGYVSSEPNSQTYPAGIELIFPEQLVEVQANEFRGDFIALVANNSAQSFTEAVELEVEAQGESAIGFFIDDGSIGSPVFADLLRSDHAPFWIAGVPAIHFTDTANFRNPHYHCLDGNDILQNMSVPHATAVALGAVEAVRGALNP